MKKMVLSVAAVVALGTGAAGAADLKAPVKAPPPVYVSPWDVAFGASLASDYIFRGVTQTNHEPGVAAYIEPRFNINPDLQLYAGIGGASISFTNRAAAEIDFYGGIRPTFGPIAFDLGVWYYWYPGGQCIDTVMGGGNLCPLGSSAIFNGNVVKSNASFLEVYGKVTWTVNDWFAVGANVFYSPDFLNTGADGTYYAANAKFTGPALFGDVGWYVSGEIGHQTLGTTDAFYGLLNLADYTTWNIGIGFTYKVFTLDLRYSGTDLSKGDCNAFTGDFTATGTTHITPINPGGLGSKWCDDRFVAKLSFDSTLSAFK